MNASTTVGIEVRAEGTQKAARDLAHVDASLKKLNAGLGGTAQPAGAAAQGLSGVGDAGKKAGTGLDGATQSATDAAQKFTGVGASAKKASESLGSVAKLAASAKFDKMATDLGAMGVKLNTSSLHAQKLARAMQQVERERAFRQLAQDVGLSTVKLAAFRAELGDTRGALATLTSGFVAAKLQILAWAAALALGGKAALDAALQMDRLDKAYTTIYGSGGAATSQLAYLQEVSNRLGLQFQSTAEAAKTFFAAGKGTSLEKDMNAIFEAVSSAGAALSLSQDDMYGTFIALGQMISKGKVQAEELRGQLGERLPRAFQLAAKAMGMTTAQLDKFMADGKLTAEDLLPKLAKVMQEDFGNAAIQSSSGIQGSLNRLSTGWNFFKASLVDSDVAVAAIDAVRGAVGMLQGAFDALSQYGGILKAITVGVGVAAGITALAAALKACLPLLALLTGALNVNAALTFSAGIMGIQKAMLALKAAMVAHPILAFAAVIGTVAGAVSYLIDEYGAAAQIMKKLDDAQSVATASAKELASAHKMSAQELGNYITKLEEQEGKLNDVEKSVRARLSQQGFYGFEKMDGNNEYVAWAFDNLNMEYPTEQLNAFEQALEDAKAESLKTSDWRALLTELEKIERESKAAGDYTDHLRVAIENARSAAHEGITYNIRIREVREVLTHYLDEQSQRNKSPNVLAAEMEEKRRQAELKDLAELREDYLKHTDRGRLEALRFQRAELQKQLNLLSATSLSQAERNEKAKYLNAQLDTTNQKIESILKKGRKKDTKTEQAQRYIENIRAEISRLNGDLSASWEQKLKVKLDDIARKGEDAHFSLDQLNTLTKEYAAAADAARVRDLADAFADLDLKIAQAAGNTRKVKEMDIAQRVEEKRRKLEGLAKTPEEKAAISEKLTTYKTSLETEVKVENLQVAADFYEKLAALSGDYSVSTAYQNQLLEAQAEIYRRALGPEHEKFIQEWEKLSRLQNSRDWGAGLERSVRSFIADSTNGARQFEDMFTNAFQSVGNIGGAALEEIFEKGSFAVDKYFANISRQIAILAANAATNQLIGGIFGFLANGLSFGGTATANAVSESTAVQGIMSNIAPVRLCHDGGRVETSGTSRAVPLSLFENAPRYHAGGFLRPDERPAILQTGEQVLSRGDTAGLGGKLDQLLAIMRGVAEALRTGNGQGAPSVVIVDDNSKIEKYMRSPEGARTFLFQMNQNRAAVKNVAQGGRA